LKAHRIYALFLRYLYLYKRSLPRFMEILYWPLLDLLVWGFVSVYLARSQKGIPNVVAFFLGALILWDILFRSQLGISVSFLEDVWARNFLNLFVSPLTVAEYLTTLMLASLVKIVLAAGFMAVLAWFLYSFDFFVIGVSLVPFIINLVALGWAIGFFTTAVILRFGQQAEILAWGVAVLFQPVSAVFYPVTVLPPVLQTVAKYVPASHVFEGMRAVISGGAFPTSELLWAGGLNLLYLAASLLFFSVLYRGVKKKGLLARVGE